MLWFLLSSTLLMALTFVFPCGNGVWRRRAMETAALLIMLLPLMRWGLESLGVEHPSLGHLAASDSTEPGVEQECLLAWAFGAVIGMALLLRKLAGVWRLRKGSMGVSQHLAHQITRELHLPMAMVEKRFRLCRDIETPVVVLGFPAMVLLPESWAEWPLRLQRSALRHEWHHVLNGDCWWSCIMRMFCTALWFHPFAWHLTGRWADECEHLADRAAVGGEDPADYAGDLLGLASRAATPMMIWQGAPGFLGAHDSRLHRRVRNLLDAHGRSPPNRAWLSLGGLALLLILAGSCAWSGVRSNAVTKEALVEEAHLRLAADAFPAD